MRKLLWATLLAASGVVANAQTYYTYYQVRDADNGNALLIDYPIRFNYTNGALAGQYDVQSTLGGGIATAGWVTFFGNSTSQCGNAVVANPNATIVSGDYSSCMTGGNHYITVRNNNATNFQINGAAVSTNSSAPTSIWYCSSTSPLTLNNASWYSSNITGSTLNIYNSGGTLLSTHSYGGGGAPASIDLKQSEFIGTRIGGFTITLSNTFNNGAAIAYTGYLTVNNATGAVDFSFNAPGGTTVPASDTPVLGASTAGISNINYVVNGITITNYKITVSGPGSILGTTTSTTALTGVQIFNAITMGYFTNDFSSYIGSNPTFSVLFEVTSPCGVFSKSASFKISSAMPWMIRIPSIIQDEENVIVSPNPAVDNVSFKWNTKSDNIGHAELIMIDVMGRVLIRQQWTEQVGYNEQTVNVANLPSGIYHYKLKKGAVTKTGKLVKE